jgi:hypothetical protein
VNSPLPPVNLPALVLALMIHYYEEERKNPERNWSMSEKTPGYREEEQPPKHKEQPQPNFYQNMWE